MNKIKLVLVAAMLLVGFLGVNAQDWKSLKNKIKEKTKGTSDNNNSSSDESSNAGDSYSDWVNQMYGITIDDDNANNIQTLERLTYEIDPDKHLKGCTELDYANTYKKLKDSGKKNADEYKYKKVLNYGTDYKNLFDVKLKGLINSEIEEAYKVRSHNENEAIKHITIAKKYIEAATLILFEDADVKTLKADVDKSFAEIAGAYEAKVYTSDFHKKNVGKILFSNKPIIIGKEDPNQFTTKFTINDNIYAVVYLKGRIKDLQSGDGGSYNLSIDGSSNEYIRFAHNPEDMEKSWYPIEITPATDKAIHAMDCKEFARVLTALSPRNHNIKIEFVGNYETFATGDLSIDLSGMDIAKINNNAETSAKNALDNYDRARKLPEDYKTSGPKYSDTELNENTLRQLLIAEWKNCAQITKVVYGEAAGADEWKINKNDVGIPTSKTPYRNIAVVYKGKDGWCYYVNWIVFGKVYEGGGKYAKVSFFDAAPHIRIDCKNCQ